MDSKLPTPNADDLAVQWREWGHEAFQEAREAGRPILLAIGAVWCHWCHVMDRESYSDPEIVRIINTEFVPIRVDNDKRPDVNSRYNLGGWPTTAFLTADGDLMTGGTYIPPERLKSLLKKISRFYQDDRDNIKERIRTLQQPEDEVEPAGPLQPAIIENLIEEVQGSFDGKYGGFGLQPKFPHTSAIDLALAGHLRTGDEDLLRIVTQTLTAMAAGGIYDHEMDGFFRYSTTRDWSIPHFEKMLEDNAGLLKNFLHAFQATGDRNLRRAAEGIIRYVDSTLSDPETGAFYGSQDANEEYYSLKKEERVKRPAPYVDRTIYTDWNCQMASSYLKAADVLGDPGLRTRGVKALEFVISGLYVRGEGAYHYHAGGRAHLPGLLGDQASLLQALTDAYQVTWDDEYLALCRDVASVLERDFWDRDEGGFYDTRPDPEALGRLARREKPLAENAVAARALLDLHQLTGEEQYREMARKTLEAFGGVYTRHGIMAGGYGLAVMAFLNPLRAAVAGASGDERARELAAGCRALFAPGLVVIRELALHREDRVHEKAPGPDVPTIYLCSGDACFPPVTDAEGLWDLVKHAFRTTNALLDPDIGTGDRPGLQPEARH